MNPKGLMLAGLGMAGLGGLLTAATYSGAEDNGGTYYVFTGLMVFGAFNFLRGLYYFLKESNRRRPYSNPWPSSSPARGIGVSTASTRWSATSQPASLPVSKAVTPTTVVAKTMGAASALPRKAATAPAAPTPPAPGVLPPATSARSFVVSPDATTSVPSSLEQSSPVADQLKEQQPLPKAPERPTPPPPTPATPRQTAPSDELKEQPPAKSPSARRRGRRFGALVGIAVLLVGAGLTGALVMRSLSSPSSQSVVGASTPGTGEGNAAAVQERPSPPAPAGFTATHDQNGWTTYTSESNGFILSLPTGWRPHLDVDLARHNRFAALDRDPSYNINSNLGFPQLMVTKFRRFNTVTPRKYFQRLRFTYANDPRTLTDVEMYSDRIPSGTAHIFRFVQNVKGLGAESYTVFTVLHNGSWYQLLFAVPVKQASSYLPVFNSIARTLRFT